MGGGNRWLCSYAHTHTPLRRPRYDRRPPGEGVQPPPCTAAVCPHGRRERARYDPLETARGARHQRPSGMAIQNCRPFPGKCPNCWNDQGASREFTASVQNAYILIDPVMDEGSWSTWCSLSSPARLARALAISPPPLHLPRLLSTFPASSLPSHLLPPSPQLSRPWCFVSLCISCFCFCRPSHSPRAWW